MSDHTRLLVAVVGLALYLLATIALYARPPAAVTPPSRPLCVCVCPPQETP